MESSSFHKTALEHHVKIEGYVKTMAQFCTLVLLLYSFKGAQVWDKKKTV